MEIINNRYRLKELIKQEKHVMVYSAYDMRKENKVILLSLLNNEYLPKPLIDFYITRFLDIKRITSKAIIRNYSFNKVFYIDNKRQVDSQYFFTSDYIPRTADLFQATKNMTFDELMDCFVEICSAVYTLHLNGFVYGALNPYTIRVLKGEGHSQVLLTDIATVHMEQLTHAERIEYPVYQSPKVLAGVPEDAESDRYALGVILLALITKTPTIEEPKKQFTSLLENSNDKRVKQLIPVVKKLLNTEDKDTYTNLYEVIVDINAVLGTNYSIIKKEEINGLNLYTKLVGRENEMKTVMRAYEKMVAYQPGKRIFFVQGPNGVGKTRFLREATFLLGLSKASVYASYSLSHTSTDSKEMWIDILRKLIMETDNSIVEKYNTELIKYFPELMDQNYNDSLNYANEHQTKYRLLNRIAGFINESIQNRPTVMIIDNIHLADAFTIDTFNYLCTEVLENTNLTLVFSCEDRAVSPNSAASDFIYMMKRRPDTETIRMEQLDEQQTGEMIQSILSISFTPKKLSSRIYSQSYGNPLFIKEIIKDLYSRRILYVSEETGKWQIDLPEESEDYNLLDLPNNIEHALVNQLKDLDPEKMDILSSISIFSKPIATHIIEKLLPNTLMVDEHLEELVNKGILQRLIDDSSYLYDFRSKILKNVVYDRISQQERIAKHQLAATSLAEQNGMDLEKNLDEIIFHFSNARNKEKARIYYLEKAKLMKGRWNTKGQIENLRKALDITFDPVEQTALYLEIGSLLTDTGDTRLAFEYLEKAERLALEENHVDHLMMAYVHLANANHAIYRLAKVREYIEKVEHILTSHPNEAARLEVKRLHASLLTEDNQLMEAAVLFEELIAECGDLYKEIKGNAYRTLGFIFVHLGKADEALEFYHESCKLSEEAQNARAMLLSLINIGALYAEVYEDYDKAMEYHLEVKQMSEEYGIYTSEVSALINIAEAYLNQLDYNTAFEHFNQGLAKAERYNLVLERYVLLNYLTQVSLERNNFVDALEYFNKLQVDLQDNPNKGFDIGGYYQTCAKLYQALGNYVEAERYSQKIIAFHSEHENMMKYTATAQVLINQLREPEQDFDDFLVKQIVKVIDKITNKSISIERLCEAIQHLSRKGKHPLATELLSMVEVLVSEDTPYRLKAIYEHAKGIVAFNLDRSCSITYFESSLHLAKISKSKELTARIQADIGNYYFNSKAYYEAAAYYLEAFETIKDLIQQLPDEYKLDYINGRSFSREFYRLNEIKRWIQSEQEQILEQEALVHTVSSLDELIAILNTEQIDFFMENDRFMRNISRNYMEKLSDGIFQPEDLLKQLDSDVSKNLTIIVKFLSGRFLATNGYILSEEKGQQVTVLSSLDKGASIPGNIAIFNRVRSTMKPVLLSDRLTHDKVDHQLLEDDIKAILCIPIIKKVESRPIVGESHQLLGYIYLETDRIVNNFNPSCLEKCMELSNFLALLMEKRQLLITASIDRLTGALTRKYLEDALQNTLDYTRKNGNEFSIIMFDLDKFKGVNDRYGHQIGDKVLKEVSQIILENLDQNSLLGRYGGEEFIIILPSVNIADAQGIAEALRSTVQGHKLLGDKQEITLSMGLASYPEHGQTVRELILKADQALYIAKENGRNNSQVWQKDFDDKVKPANKLTGIISGDEIRDARNVLALVELIQLTNLPITVEEKIYQFLGRMVEIMEAQYGYIVLTEGNSIIKSYGRKSQEEEWVKEHTFNQQIITTVLKEESGMFTIDWEATEKINPVNGLPDWDSILAMPITADGTVKGVMYMSAPARLKEFGADELNVMNVYSELVANII